MIEGMVAAIVHGRHLIVAANHDPAPLLVGFHGYAEDAETQAERLCVIDGSQRWLKVAIQALHPFYQRRTDKVVASWMTRQNREAAIADNIAYVQASIDTVVNSRATMPTVVFAGFSQGVAMAFRAAAASKLTVAGVIAAGSGIPPELDPAALRHVRAALLARGTTDAWYTPRDMADDERRLQEASVPTRRAEWEGGHEWTEPLNAAARIFLDDCLSASIGSGKA